MTNASGYPTTRCTSSISESTAGGSPGMCTIVTCVLLKPSCMRSIVLSALTFGAFALTGACSTDSPVEPGPPTPVSLNLCPTLLPDWFAYQNEGGQWTQVTPNADGVVSFDATAKVSIARVIDF